MNTEIERKFIVLNSSYKQLGTSEYCIQGYIRSTKKPFIRIRTIGTQSFLTMKSNINEISRIEYEYKIPNKDAKELLELFCKNSIIEKYRYKIQYKGTLWEVDEFLGDNKGLVIAEVELISENSIFNKPDWIGKEVSSDKRYYNYNLFKHPYNKW